MLALRLFRYRLFRATNIVMAFGMASFIGLTFVLPLYLQGLRGLDPLDSGLTTFPQAIGILISSQIAGRIYGRVGPAPADHRRHARRRRRRWPRSCCVGLDTDLWWIRGGDLRYAAWRWASGSCPSQAASYAEIPPADNGRASAIFSTQRQMSVSIGIALMATVLTSFTTLTAAPTDPEQALTGYHWTFAVATGLALIAALLACPVRPRRGRRGDDATTLVIADDRSVGLVEPGDEQRHVPPAVGPVEHQVRAGGRRCGSRPGARGAGGRPRPARPRRRLLSPRTTTAVP